MLTVQGNIRERAAACAFAARSAANLSDRFLFSQLEMLWRALADEAGCLDEAELAQEIADIGDLHCRIIAAIYPTIH
jgi:hypothetical protein